MKYLKILFKIISFITLLIISGIVGIYFFIQVFTTPYIGKSDSMDSLPKADAAIVLGAAVLNDGTLSLILKDRADTAIALYTKNLVKVILVTGDNGSSYHNEVNPTREYLLSKGIPSGAIFLDHAGFDTYSSMYRARDVFLVSSAIIATQPFHLPRAVFIARSLGIKAYGIPSDQHTYSIKNNMREFLADVKSVLDILSKRKPEYLGTQIPISGSSHNSI
jgi:SanA protein